MLRVCFFHTAPSNIAILDEACATAPLLAPQHIVNQELFARVQEAGELDGALREEAQEHLQAALADADVVVCTCSTLGPAADDLASTGAAVQRIDRALAERALAADPPLCVLVSVGTTLEPTRALFREVARSRKLREGFDVQLVEGAWTAFQNGNTRDYHRRIAESAAAAHANGSSVALGQVSMAGAAKLCPFPVLTSPGEAIAALSAAYPAGAVMPAP
jgi:hypothetical protein